MTRFQSHVHRCCSTKGYSEGPIETYQAPKNYYIKFFKRDDSVYYYGGNNNLVRKLSEAQLYTEEQAQQRASKIAELHKNKFKSINIYETTQKPY